MPPKNWVDLKSTPVTWRKFELPKITVLGEVSETPKSIGLYQDVEFTLTFKTPKRWRCLSRKRFIKLMMSEGVSRNNAERLANFTRELMPYWRAWRDYLLTGPAERMMLL